MQTHKASCIHPFQKHKKQAIFCFHLWDDIMIGWNYDRKIGWYYDFMIG